MRKIRILAEPIRIIRRSVQARQHDGQGHATSLRSARCRRDGPVCLMASLRRLRQGDAAAAHRRAAARLRTLMPEGEGPFPVVIQMHGCGGKKNLQERWAEVAKAGWAVIVVDSYAHRKISTCRPTPPSAPACSSGGGSARAISTP